MTEEVKKRPKLSTTDQVLIPFRSKTQPLDVHINSPFKVSLIQLYTEWMASGDHPLISTREVKQSNIQQLH